MFIKYFIFIFQYNKKTPNAIFYIKGFFQTFYEVYYFKIMFIDFIILISIINFPCFHTIQNNIRAFRQKYTFSR